LYHIKKINKDQLYEGKEKNINNQLQEKEGIVRSIFKEAMALDINALSKC
jgi:hypothetical protein